MDIDYKELENGSIKLPVSRTLYLNELLKKLKGTEVNKDREYKEIVNVLDKDSIDSDIEIPKNIDVKLRAYQKIGFKWLKTLDLYKFGGILADDMGLGKTIQIITLLESSLKSQSNSMERVSATLSADINNLVSAVNKSIGDYEAMVEQLNKLIPVLQEHIKHSEDSVSASEQNSEKLTEVLKTLDEIVKKNQQLRYELTQWRRVHKKVKINDKNGTKECPNCSAENPIDANFCRKCNYGFWDCETIASSLK